MLQCVRIDPEDGVAEVDVVGHARAFLDEKLASGELEVPEGSSFAFAGTYENQVRSEQRLKMLVPVALLLVFVLLYLQFRRVSTVLIIYSGVVVAVAGGLMLIWLYGQDWFMRFSLFGVDMQELLRVEPVSLSVAVWVGVIALIGITTDDGVVMATYLHQRFAGWSVDSRAGIRQRVLEAGKRRVRPCLMTTATTILALLPVITSKGRGADIMAPMALPVLGGMAVALCTLFVVPVLFAALEEVRLTIRQRQSPTATGSEAAGSSNSSPA